MRQAVFLLLVAGVFRCALCRPDETKLFENELHLQERESHHQEHRLQDDGPHLQDENNVEGEATENENQVVENEQDDHEAADEGSEDDNGEEAEDQGEADDELDNDLSSEHYEDESKTVVSDKPPVTTSSSESKVLQTGNKKRKTKNSGPSKKMASKLLPLLMIPLMIQAQLIPMMLLKLKFMALKALMLGKAALVIILLNLLKNAFLGANSMEEQYEQQTLASHHYGYSGGPEYGAWINKRVYNIKPNDPYRGHQFVASTGQQDTNGRSVLLEPAAGLNVRSA